MTINVDVMDEWPLEMAAGVSRGYRGMIERDRRCQETIEITVNCIPSGRISSHR